MQDSYDNLVVTNVPPRRWTLTYEGAGCLPCRHNLPCECSTLECNGENEAFSSEITLSECDGGSTARNGLLEIAVNAPTMIGPSVVFKIQVRTWQGAPLHSSYLLSNNGSPFEVTHADTGSLDISRLPSDFPHLVAGEPFSIDVDIFDISLEMQ